jgi:hypothetical protein
MKFLEYLKGSLDNHSIGASARKLTAFIIVVMIVVSDIMYLKEADFVEFNSYLIIHFISLFLLLGLVTVEQIIRFKKQ